VNEVLRIAMVSAERVPLAKVGGLGDVAGALADVLAERGHEVSCFLPDYATLTLPEGARRERVLEPFPVPHGRGEEPAALDRVTLRGTKAAVYLVDHRGPQAFFRRDGIYTDPATALEYADNPARFLFFSRAVCEALKRLGRRQDVIHLNDNQTAFVAAFLREAYAADPFFQRTATLFAIHNLGYQGLYPPEVLEIARLSRDRFHPGSPFEFYGKVNFLKVGLEYADFLSTVSPGYAREIQSDPEIGAGLQGVLAHRAADLAGILNGIDYRVWNPGQDPRIAARYTARDLTGKQVCRAALAREAGWPADSDWAIVGMISRLADQKGFDLVEAALPELLRQELRLFVLGAGQKRYEELFRALAREHPDRVCARVGFDDDLAHRVEAGADLFLMPSRYEPCGLNQMMSQRYGTIPVVRATGGLADTVRDFDPATRHGTGFVFADYDAGAMTAAVKRALAIYRQPRVWHRLVENAMKQDFSWEAAAGRYEEIYREARSRVEARRFREWAQGVARA